MKIAVSGYRGLIGKALTEGCLARGHEVVPLSREMIYSPPGRALTGLLSGVQAVIHLAGAPILCRWTHPHRKLIYDSRVETTSNLTEAICQLPDQLRPETFISASAIGIYRSEEDHTERSDRFASHFAARVIRDWEAASAELPAGVRRAIFRISPVLDQNSQLIRQLRLPFRLGLGGAIGNGSQPFPFIHLHDAVSAFLWAAENRQAAGVYNLCAPQQATNRDFTQTFARALRRPAFLSVPKTALDLLYGEAARLIYESPQVYPEKLLAENFTFRYPTLEAALTEIVGKK